jgi:predicted ferric reductase
MASVLLYLSRATGIVAAILVVAALVWGFFFSARETGKRLRPAWWLDLHNWLGGLALIFTLVHIVASFLDSNAGIGVVQVFVPGTAELDGWGIGWGVVATYLLVVVVFTTWPRRLGHRRWWRVLHLTSVVATAMALVHAYQSGSDSNRLEFRVGLLAATALATYALGIRLFGLDLRRYRRVSHNASTPGNDSQLAHSSDTPSPNGGVADYGHEQHH